MWSPLQYDGAAWRARRLGALFVALILVLSALPAHPAGAVGPPIEATGTYTRTSIAQSNIRTMGNVTMLDFTETQVWTGTFTGTTVLHGSCVVRPSLQAVCQAMATFTGTVAGRSGTAELHLVVFIDMATRVLHANFTIVGGTGDLAALHGHGTVQALRGTGPYEAKLIFAP